MGKLLRRLTVAAALAMSAACTTSQVDVPPVTGPSELGLSIRLTASPDSLSQDGASQSAIGVTALDANSRPVAGLPIRLDMVVDQTIQDFGRLSARTVVTGTDGRATSIYTAPPPPPPLSGGAQNVVSIMAVPTGTNFDTIDPLSPGTPFYKVSIRLVTPGVILPPAGTPTAAFTFSPTTVTANVPVVFDASASIPGPGASAITSYNWSFGDGTTGTGRTVTHAFRSIDSVTVTLTVTNDRGLSASSSQAIVPSASILQANFTVSPGAAVPNQPNTFDASTSVVPIGARIVDYAWNFGDDTQVIHSSTPVVRHTYAVASNATYVVTLTITDNFGNTSVTSNTLAVTGVGQPALAAFTMTPQPASVGQEVTFDSYLSRPGAGGGRIVNQQWDFGDGSGVLGTGGPEGGTIVTHTYSRAGTYTVTLKVTTDFGNTGTVSHTLLVQ